MAVIVALSASNGVSATAIAAPAWSKPVTLGPTGREGGTPEIAVTPDGEAVVVWEGGQPKGIQVTSRRPGQDWGPPLLLRRGSETDPQIAATGRKAVVVWGDDIEARGVEASAIFAATRQRGGRWSKPRNIAAEKGGLYESEGRDPQVAITRRGEAIAMWTAGDERHSSFSFIRASTQPLRGGWTAPHGLRGSIEGEEPQLGVTPKGEAVAIWNAYYNEESGIEVASRPPGGKWSYVKRLANPGAFPDPRLAITSTGEAVAAWEFEEPSHGLQEATRKPRGRWSVRTLAPPESEAFSAPQVVAEPGGAAAVVWARSIFRSGSEREEDAVATHRRDGAWTEPVSLFGEGVALRRPAIAVTGSGEWIAMWSSVGPEGETAIQASSRGLGQPWEAPVNVSGSPAARPSGSSDLRVAVAPSGEAFAVWRAYDGTRWVIEAATRPPA
ncbi:MAG TPA: hypothetical protein VG448_04725 [Solirubrobacterales bacterium]|nr:hypothetical protein [Solirubrobacterales bacterium]